MGNGITAYYHSNCHVISLRSLSIANEGKVYVEIINQEGKIIQTLVNKTLSTGKYEVVFEAKTVNAGIYFYRLRQGSFSESRKLVIID
jgi:hypothetical protein